MCVCVYVLCFVCILNGMLLCVPCCIAVGFFFPDAQSLLTLYVSCDTITTFCGCPFSLLFVCGLSYALLTIHVPVRHCRVGYLSAIKFTKYQCRKKQGRKCTYKVTLSRFLVILRPPWLS